MKRMHWAFFISLGVHATLFATPEFFSSGHPQVSVTPGETRVAIFFQEAPPPPFQKEEFEITLPEKKEERPKRAEKVPVVSSPQSEGVEWTDPRYLRNRPPEYPRSAFLRNIEGLVILEVAVDPEGHPISVQVERSSGFSILDEAALKAVREWEFVPARRAGISVQSRCRIPIRFQIEERIDW